MHKRLTAFAFAALLTGGCADRTTAGGGSLPSLGSLPATASKRMPLSNSGDTIFVLGPVTGIQRTVVTMPPEINGSATATVTVSTALPDGVPPLGAPVIACIQVWVTSDILVGKGPALWFNFSSEKASTRDSAWVYNDWFGTHGWSLLDAQAPLVPNSSTLNFEAETYGPPYPSFAATTNYVIAIVKP